MKKLLLLFSLLLATPASAQWQVQQYSVPIGRGAGVIGFSFAAPSNVAGCLTSIGASAAPTFGSTSSAQCGPTSYVTTIAELRALPSGAAGTISYVYGYAGSGDGGEGWFYWASASSAPDDNITVIRPNSLPATGRWIRFLGNTVYSVKWAGAKGDCVTNDSTAFQTTVTAASAIHGTVFIPAVANCYKGNFSVQDIVGLRILGESAGTGLIPGVGGSRILGVTSGAAVLNVFSNVGSGNVGHIHISNLNLQGTGAGSFGLRIWNALNFNVQSVTVYGDTGMTIQGSGNGVVSDLLAYGNIGLYIGNGEETLTNSGPITVISPHLSQQGTSGPSLLIKGQTLGITITSPDLNSFSADASNICTIQIDGDSSPLQVGDITIYNGHTESVYNSTNSGADICISPNAKFGSVNILGGSWFGHGNSVNYRQDWLRVYSNGVKNLVVDGIRLSNLNVTGYSRAAVRFDATPDKYSIRSISADITGTLYSDASGVLTGATGNASNIPELVVGARTFVDNTFILKAPTLGGLLTQRYADTAANSSVRWPVGSTDFTSTGGTSQVVRQSSAGAALTVGVLAASDVGAVPTTRNINTTSPITGGGDLSADRTLACATCGVTTGTLAQFAPTTSAQFAGVISDETGTGALVFATNPVLVTPNLGIPSAVTLTNATGLPISTGVSGLGTGVATFLGTPSSANLAAAVTNETGSGALVFGTSPALVTPDIGVATATSVNKVAITAPATSATLTVANGKTLTASNTITLTATDGVTIPFGTRTRQTFTSGSGTYTTPANVKYIYVRALGGGSGGSGSGTTPGIGAAGNNTTFSTLTAGGATAGGTVFIPGSGGSTSGCSPGFNGGSGQTGTNATNTNGGSGAGSAFSGVVWGQGATTGSSASNNTGAGAAGAGSGATAGAGAGGGSGAYCELLITAPAATYSYSVGAGGSAGSAGTGGSAGGAGGSGVIIVDEFYSFLMRRDFDNKLVPANDNWRAGSMAA